MRDRILAMKSVPIARLRGFSGGNPKTPTPGDLQHLDASIANHGYVTPVVVRELGDGSFEVIDGHSRVNVIAAKEPGAKIKVIVLDVESVHEGRRILLALQQHVQFDISKLDEFVVESMAAGGIASELMQDIGDIANQLDAFGERTARAVREAAPDNSVDDDGDDDGEPRGPSRAGLTTEHVPFAVPVSREQSVVISEALSLAKRITGRKVKGDALEVIAIEYLHAHKDERGKKKKKRNGGQS